MDYAQESLKLHAAVKGKIEIATRVAADSREALSLAYTPGRGGTVPGDSAESGQVL